MVLQVMESYITGIRYVNINNAPHSCWMIPESWWDVLTFYLLSMALR